MKLMVLCLSFVNCNNTALRQTERVFLNSLGYQLKSQNSFIALLVVLCPMSFVLSLFYLTCT